MRRGWLVLIALYALGASPASGADFDLSTEKEARHPSVAFSSDGTAHVAWNRANDSDADDGADDTQYCRVPRGATGCAPGSLQTLPRIGGSIAESFGATNVLLDGDRVLVSARRCCSPDGTFLWISSDGGATFGPPREIGDLETTRLVAGPGPLLVSGTNDVAGTTRYQAMPIDEGTAGDKIAAVGEGSGFVAGYYGSTGFVDSNTPIVAWSDLDKMFFRVFDPQKGTDYNVLANWGPLRELGPGDQPKLVSGISGTYLFYNTDTVSDGDSSYVVKAYDRAVGNFSAMPTQVSEKGNGPIFGDFAGDEGGGLVAAWVSNGSTDPIRIRQSANGKSWLPIQTVEAATDDGAFNLRVAAAPDGGGAVVYDGNGSGPIRMATFPPRSSASEGIDQDGSGEGGCKFKVAIKGSVEALAQGGCFTKLPGGRYGTDAPVAINGMVLQPPATARAAAVGGPAQGPIAMAAASDAVVIDPNANTIKTKPNVEVRAGSVVLDRNGVSWDADKPVEFPSLEKFGIKFFGFGVAGNATVKFTPKGAEIPVHVELPGFLKGVRGDVLLRTDKKQGLLLSNLFIKASDVKLGALTIKDLEVKYDKDSSLFNGKGDLRLNPATDDGLKFAFAFEEGQFKSASVEIGPGIPPLPLPISAPPAAFLDRVKLAVDATDGVKIVGGVGLSAGPSVAGTRAIGIDGKLTLDFPASKPWALFQVDGAIKVVEIPLASAFVSYRTDGIFKFGGEFGYTAPLGIASANGKIGGIIVFSPLAFQVDGSVKVCFPASCKLPALFGGGDSPLQGSAEALVSSNGFGACVDVGVSIGLGKLWGSPFDLYESGCDVSKYKIAAARAAQDGPTAVSLTGGLPQVNVAVTGRDGPPLVKLTGPDGRTISSDPRSTEIPVRTDVGVVYSDPSSKTTFVALARPPGGRWSVEALSGSTPLTGVRTADGLPDVRVTGSVSGRARARTLRYAIRSIPGQKVTFVERSDAVAQGLGKTVTSAGSGTVRFAPADGPAGRRTIQALVEQDGKPRKVVDVASYVAPGPVVPSRVSKLRVRRSGKDAAVATWGPARGAREYLVRMTATDGRKHLVVTRSRRVRLTRLERWRSATVTVTATNARGRSGPPARAVLAAGRRPR